MSRRRCTIKNEVASHMTAPSDPHLLVTLHEHLSGNWDEGKVIVEKAIVQAASTDALPEIKILKMSNKSKIIFHMAISDRNE